MWDIPWYQCGCRFTQAHKLRHVQLLKVLCTFCFECSLTVHADYLIILLLSEIQRVFSQFRDVAKVMIMQKKIYPNFSINQRWTHLKKKSFYILDYLWEIIIKMSGDLEMLSFKSGQFWPFVPFVPLYQLKSYFSDQNLVKKSLVIFFISLVRSRLCRLSEGPRLQTVFLKGSWFSKRT